ncbi:GntP family permease [Neisseria meningitidis]|uniref:GntP family permease n=1 Tax=Neisseria meningitidis TaxID=487 RepID=UPI000F537538|nr:GntP family permease [Neisseria meningitidis]RQJ85280.1 permease [Neisseria meningitidis]RQL35363.1 permease [Neisseria meningitidis]
MDGWTQTLSAQTLLGISAAAIILILILIVKFRIHALLTLVIVSLLTALATGLPTGSIVNDVLVKNFGGTLGGVALLVGLGAMLGRLVETSGGAQSLADALIRMFGEKRAPFALGVASLIFGFPIFFDAGLIVMLPIVFATARRMKQDVLPFALASIGAFSVMHVFLPPHPGPIAASEFYGANIGQVLILGLPTAFITWYFSGYMLGKVLGRTIHVPVPELLSGGTQDNDLPKEPAKAGTVVAIMLIPMLLIFLNTGVSALISEKLVSADETWVQTAKIIGSTPIALLISVLVALFVLGRKRGESGSALALRIAQGSATVALTTAAALMAPAVAAAGFTDWQLACIVLATAAGSVGCSHFNDSGFWLVGRLLDMDVPTTLKTWTVNQTLIALIGFALSALLFAIV